MRHRSLAGEGVDEFDPKRLVTWWDTRVCCRRLGPTMILVLFPDLERTGLLLPHAAMVESSRFCAYTSLEPGEGRGVAAHNVTLAMFVTIIEWSNGRCQRLSRHRHGNRCPFRANSQACRLAHDTLGAPRSLGNMMAVAGLLPADRDSFERLRPASLGPSSTQSVAPPD